jgi:Ubiquitin-conjugating enzyme
VIPVCGPASFLFAVVRDQFGIFTESLLCRVVCTINSSNDRDVGQYAPGVLRLQISFPERYPEVPPLITFSTDIFHPLVVPLTTYTFSSGAVDAIGTVSASDDQRLPSGAFSLRNGFPDWFRQSMRAGDSRNGSRRVSSNNEVGQNDVAAATSEEEPNSQPTLNCSIVNALAYLRSSFEEPEILDNLPLEAAANPGAWHAWRSYRGLPKAASRAVSPAQGEAGKGPMAQKQPGDWNWEGVFEKRVKSGVESSISDAVLFGSSRLGAQGNDTIRFRKLDDEQLNAIKDEMMAGEVWTRR